MLCPGLHRQVTTVMMMKATALQTLLAAALRHQREQELCRQDHKVQRVRPIALQP
jgi:hypothetical protein